jgi:glycosyltransferase involved in cell wall biosynthesis
MKILMILSNPFMVDPRVYKEAESLVDAGHEVTVIVWDRKRDYEPENTVDGINLIRVHNKWLMRLLPNDLSRNPVWWRKAYKKGLELYKDDFKFDVVHCHDLDTLQVGVWLKEKLGVKLIYDAHEIFGYMIARNRSKSVVMVAFWMEKRLVKNVDHIITVNEPLEDYFKSITDKPITIVMNCKDVIGKEYQPTNNNIFTLCYIGVLHKNRMFPELVDILGKMKDVKFVIAGKKENLYEEVKKRSGKYDNIEFLGTLPFNDVIPKTIESDVVICMINPDDANNKIGLANKQFEAMVCGRPIICTNDTFSGKMTENLNCGIAVDYNADSLREGIFKLKNNKNLCEQIGKHALKLSKEKYNWDKEREKLANLYENLIKTDKNS